MKFLARLAGGAAVLTLMAFMAGCSQSTPAPSQQQGSAPAGSGRATALQESDLSSQTAAERMVVRNASLRMAVAKVDDVLSKAARLVDEMGGYVASTESRQVDGDWVGKASLRVPAARLDETMSRLKEMASRVEYEATISRDVTDEYTDQDARLRTLRALESQYLELLKSAKTTDDIIKIQQSLQQVRQQIEQTEARIQSLKRSVEMATINLDLFTAATARPVLSGDGWSPAEVLSQALHGFVAVMILLAGLAIWVVVFVPIWLPALFLFRWLRRRRQKSISRGSAAVPVGDGS